MYMYMMYVYMYICIHMCAITVCMRARVLSRDALVLHVVEGRAGAAFCLYE